jgi:hypothetical protein
MSGGPVAASFFASSLLFLAASCHAGIDGGLPPKVRPKGELEFERSGTAAGFSASCAGNPFTPLLSMLEVEAGTAVGAEVGAGVVVGMATGVVGV